MVMESLMLSKDHITPLYVFLLAPSSVPEKVVGIARRLRYLRIVYWKVLALTALAACAAFVILWDGSDGSGNTAKTEQIPDDDGCMACHNVSTPFIVADYLAGDMGQSGVRCTDCHFAEPTDADAVSHNSYTIATKPSPGDCSRCHPDQTDQFNESKHVIGWTKMDSNARSLHLPEEVRLAMCEGCHNIGIPREDGSFGKCDSCHTRHSFNKEEARKPESCGTCHMGPDHPQIEAYLSSKHGVTYTLESETWAWSDPATFTAPVCTTCHQPSGTHNVDIGITIGGTSSGYRLSGYIQPFPMGTITEAAFEGNRSLMVSVCGDCHSESFAREQLSAADSVKNETDMLVGEARLLLMALYEEGLLQPMPENRTANPITGFNLTLMGQQTYSNTSGIETLFFKMYKYHGVTAWKGAYHFSPDYTHWYGFAEGNHDLELIKAEDIRLREIAALQDEPPDEDDEAEVPTWMTALTIGALLLALVALIMSAMLTRRSKKEPPKTS